MRVLHKILLTEKQTAQTEKLAERAKNPINRYGFLVTPDAHKNDIKKAIEELYEVKVDKINTMNYDGKVIRRNTASGLVVGRRSAFKKAIVTLKEGYNIDLYRNI